MRAGSARREDEGQTLLTEGSTTALGTERWAHVGTMHDADSTRKGRATPVGGQV